MGHALLGMGGVGKTMLVRYLTVKLAKSFPERLLVGRVDFDHLDPRFPWERPAELLVVLADALLVHAGVREESLVEALVEAVRRADEQRTPGAPMQATDPAMTPVYDRFGDLLEALLTPTTMAARAGSCSCSTPARSWRSSTRRARS